MEVMEDRTVLSDWGLDAGLAMIRSPGVFTPTVTSPPAPVPVSQTSTPADAVARSAGVFNLDPGPQPGTNPAAQAPRTTVLAIEQLFRQKYQELGGDGRGVGGLWVFRRIGAANPLGGAVTGVQQMRDGSGYFQDFQKGSLYWSPATGVHAIHGPVRDRWLAAGGHSVLGYPSTDTLPTADAVGRYNHFLKTAGGVKSEASVYWSPNTGGAFVLQGAIRAKYARTGFDRGPLGLPRSEESSTPGGAGRAVVFQNGVVVWSPATEAHALTGSIAAKWTGMMNWGRGWDDPKAGRLGAIGLPTTDVLDSYAELGIEGGTVARFQNGAVVASAAGTFFLEGAVYARFLNSPEFFGFPVADLVRATPAGVGQVASFENGGVIVWNGRSDSPAVELHGPVLEKWAARGGGHGPLGFPTHDVFDLPAFEAGMFDRGDIRAHRGGLLASEVIYEQGESLVYGWDARARHDKWIVRWYANGRLGRQEDRGGQMSHTLVVPARPGVWYDFHVKAGDESGNPFYPYDYTPWTGRVGYSLGRTLSGPPAAAPETLPEGGTAGPNLGLTLLGLADFHASVDSKKLSPGESFTVRWQEQNYGQEAAGAHTTTLLIYDMSTGELVLEEEVDVGELEPGAVTDGLEVEVDGEELLPTDGDTRAGKRFQLVLVIDSKYEVELSDWTRSYGALGTNTHATYLYVE
jgi:hypothetical protein